MTDNEATRTTFVRTHEDMDEAEPGCYEAEAENFGLDDLTALVLTSTLGKLESTERANIKCWNRAADPVITINMSRQFHVSAR